MNCPRCETAPLDVQEEVVRYRPPVRAGDRHPPDDGYRHYKRRKGWLESLGDLLD